MNMKSKKVLITLAVLMTLMLFGVLIYLPLTGSGCNGGAPPPSPCCPKIDANSFTYTSVICSPKCPNGGKVEVYGSLEFYSKEELCAPPKDFRISIYNVTDGKDEPPLEINPGKQGVYAFKTTFDLDHDAEFELHATGDKDCGTARQKFKVKVLEPEEYFYYDIKYTEKKNAFSAPFVEWKRHEIFGSSLLLDSVLNENDFKIHADAVYLKADLSKKGDPGDRTWNSQKKMYATGDYAVQIDEFAFAKYVNLNKPEIVLRVGVKCDCP
jgi:hypothetical protein